METSGMTVQKAISELVKLGLKDCTDDANKRNGLGYLALYAFEYSVGDGVHYCFSDADVFELLEVESSVSPETALVEQQGSEKEHDMLERAVQEVRSIVAANGDGTGVWHIWNGVDAGEVLFGYSKNEGLLSWFSPSHTAYRSFIAYWNTLQGCKYCSESTGLSTCDICGCLCCSNHAWVMREDVKEYLRISWDAIECSECVCK